MTKAAICIEQVSKLYRIGRRSGNGYSTLREQLVDVAKAPLRYLGGSGRIADDNANACEHWALRDVSFKVEPGEAVGIIGRNGAGKSTLLKIVSRITEPSSGRVEMRGRLSSLLEVGTGFHPELTGRENIYLNGAILGMSRREIARKFDEIVAFAEVEQFLDTPVKHYSSGMYVRLAFAVASHLETEILVVDEVLAVGDQAFQKKCLGKMGAISRSGRTVIFVSHSMPTILNLCQQVAVLDRGRLSYMGPCEQGVQRYLKDRQVAAGADVDLSNHPNRRRGKGRVFQRLRILDGQGEPVTQPGCGDRMALEFLVEHPAGRQMHYGAWVEDSLGSRLFTVGTHLSRSELPASEGPRRVRCDLGRVMLAPGQYHLFLFAGPIYQMSEDVIDQAASFEVLGADVHGNGRLPNATQGPFVVPSAWTAVDE